MYQSGILKSDGSVARSATVKGDVPTLYEVFKAVHKKEPSGPDWEAWRAIGLGISNLTRTLVLPPGIAGAKVGELREAVGKMAKDPGFIKDWGEGLRPEARSGACDAGGRDQDPRRDHGARRVADASPQVRRRQVAFRRGAGHHAPSRKGEIS